MMSQVFVSGHKSPDTDSIAAALSYSYLKRRLGMDAVAVRAGEINKESRLFQSGRADARDFRSKKKSGR